MQNSQTLNHISTAKFGTETRPECAEATLGLSPLDPVDLGNSKPHILKYLRLMLKRPLNQKSKSVGRSPGVTNYTKEKIDSKYLRS